MKNNLIPERLFEKDFKEFTGFYDYHVKKQKISLALNDIQGFGVELKVTKPDEIQKMVDNSLAINTIYFSSSKKKNNVKNLMWTIRCLTSHPENISELMFENIKCYKIYCTRKTNGIKQETMKAIIACDIWKEFIKNITTKIIENEKY